jgi:hypothetical protein
MISIFPRALQSSPGNNITVYQRLSTMASNCIAEST